MSDDRWNSDDERAPYIDRAPLPGQVKPAPKQPDGLGPPTPEEIEAFIAAEFGSKKSEKKQLVRPPGWDDGFDQAIAKMILGASMTTDADAGSRMAAEVHERMLFGEQEKDPIDPAEEFER